MTAQGQYVRSVRYNSLTLIRFGRSLVIAVRSYKELRQPESSSRELCCTAVHAYSYEFWHALLRRCVEWWEHQWRDDSHNRLFSTNRTCRKDILHYNIDTVVGTRYAFQSKNIFLPRLRATECFTSPVAQRTATVPVHISHCSAFSDSFPTEG